MEAGAERGQRAAGTIDRRCGALLDRAHHGNAAAQSHRDTLDPGPMAGGRGQRQLGVLAAGQRQTDPCVLGARRIAGRTRHARMQRHRAGIQTNR